MKILEGIQLNPKSPLISPNSINLTTSMQGKDLQGFDLLVLVPMILAPYPNMNALITLTKKENIVTYILTFQSPP